jgi:hypothetical protein
LDVVADWLELRVGKGPALSPVLDGALVVGWIQQVEGPPQVVPVVVVLCLLDLLVGPRLERVFLLLPKTWVSHRRHEHCLVLRPEEW